MRFLPFGLLFILSLGSLAAQASTIPIISNGQLIGATNVNVGGVLFDFEFVEGSCIGLFDGCDATNDFQSFPGGSLAAAQALIDQVLLDGVNGNFASNPVLTFGCGQVFACGIVIPELSTGSFGFNGTPISSGAIILQTPFEETASLVPQIFGNEDTTNSSIVFARFSPTPIPLPGAAWLLLSALGGLVTIRILRAHTNEDTD